MPVEIKVVIPDISSQLEDDDDVNDDDDDEVHETKSETHVAVRRVKKTRKFPKPRPSSAPPQAVISLHLPVASNYDVDNEYDYIMDKALHAYKKHREKDKSDVRQQQLWRSYKRRSLCPSSKGSRQTPGNRPRPWTALPSKFDVIKEVGQANGLLRESTPRKVLNVRTITLGSGDMDAADRKANNYQKRNQTSCTWYSQSVPNANFLQQPVHAGQPRPISNKKSKSLTTSPSKAEDASKRPASSYEYDGGLFNPCTPRRDYFVIHPDWVSESVTIQKLSLNERQVQKSRTWPHRRCRSAPPPKFRNPITWE